MPTTRPGKVWNAMLDGNARFVAGEPQHPHQDVERREIVAVGQDARRDSALAGCRTQRVDVAAAPGARVDQQQPRHVATV